VLASRQRISRVAASSNPVLPQARQWRQRVADKMQWAHPELWMKFVLGFLGLALAFAAALFSTVSREAGNLWATLILSSAALILATLVGLTTVPHLARRVVAGSLRDAVDYEVTRSGIVYVLMTVLIAVAALNTGNNLLYIVVAAMLAAILVSGIASAIALRGLQLEVSVPPHVFANTPVLGRVTVRNPRRWLPSFSIQVVPSKRKKPGQHWTLEPATFPFPGKGKQWLLLPDRRVRRVAEDAPPPGIFEGAAHFPFLPPNSELSADLELCFRRRGEYVEDSFGLATRFPFSFLTKTRRLPLARSVLVYPAVEPADDLLHILPTITGELETFVRGRGYDLYRIREYMPEDSARHVDWKATARSGSLKVREFSREDERRIRLIFDNPPPGALSETAYERGVALAASLAWHFSLEDTELSFAAQEYAGEPDVYQFLRHLAVVMPSAGASVLVQLAPTDDYNIVLTTQTRGSIPTALWNSSYVIFLDEQGSVGRGRSQRPEKLLRRR
jgi:uncharacterized protein (DUF58 family)